MSKQALPSFLSNQKQGISGSFSSSQKLEDSTNQKTDKQTSFKADEPPLKKALEAEITSFSKKGEATAEIKRGESKRKVYFTGAIIGDKVAFNMPRGRLPRKVVVEPLAIIKPSEQRVEPRCAHAGICGGCSWQEMAYSAQLKHKEELVTGLFKPFHVDSVYHPIIGAKKLFDYRNKMEFSFSQDKVGGQFLGLNQPGKKQKIITIDRCHLVNSWVSDVLKAVRAWWKEYPGIQAYHFMSGTGCLQTLTLREGKKTGEKMVILTVSQSVSSMLDGKALNSLKAFIKQAFDGAEGISIFLRIHSVKKGRGSEYYEMHLSGKPLIKEELTIKGKTFTFAVSPSSFFQPNTEMAEVIYEKALELAQPKQEDKVLDLYAGAATFGTIFAPFVKRVLSIEYNPYAVCDGETNLELNHIDNVAIIKGDVGKVLEEYQGRADLAIVDPPRMGLDATAVSHLMRLKANKLLYVSCNVHTQVENIKEFIRGGYQIKAVQPIDQFPHTPHLENIVLLQQTL